MMIEPPKAADSVASVTGVDAPTQQEEEAALAVRHQQQLEPLLGS
jgi:hypothetical protein